MTENQVLQMIQKPEIKSSDLPIKKRPLFMN
jgi:hypothetical protein